MSNYVSAKTGLNGIGINTGVGFNSFNPFSYYKDSSIVNFNTPNDPISGISLMSGNLFNNLKQTNWMYHNGHQIGENHKKSYSMSDEL